MTGSELVMHKIETKLNYVKEEKNQLTQQKEYLEACLSFLTSGYEDQHKKLFLEITESSSAPAHVAENIDDLTNRIHRKSTEIWELEALKGRFQNYVRE